MADLLKQARLRDGGVRQVGAGRSGHRGHADAPRLRRVLRLLRPAPGALLLSGVPASQRREGPAAQSRAGGAAQPGRRPRRGPGALQPGRDRGGSPRLPGKAPPRALLPLPPVHHPARGAAGAGRCLRSVRGERPQHLPGDAVCGEALRSPGHAARDLRGHGLAARPRRGADPRQARRAGPGPQHDRVLHQRQRAGCGRRAAIRSSSTATDRCAGSSATSTRVGSGCP